jgi:3-hydroxyanthranilate 3,4-dioxygenase
VSPVNEPFGLFAWIAEHAADFEPPVANKVVWTDSDFIFMIVRGPNARNDFHVDPHDEIFFQLRGEVRVDIIAADGVRHQRRVGEGDVMLVPGGTPHAPMRPANSWGLVVERPRADGLLDELRWYCDCCGTEVHRVTFALADIETSISSALAAFNEDETLRTCGSCGCVVPVPGEFVLGDDG